MMSDDGEGWTVEPTNDGIERRWRVRMDRVDVLDSRLPEDYWPVLQAAADATGSSLPAYLSWVAHRTAEDLHHYRDRIMNGSATEEDAVLYYAWLDVRGVLVEHQQRFPGRDWGRG